MTGDDARMLAMLDALRARGITSGRIRIPSGLEVEFSGPPVVATPDDDVAERPLADVVDARDSQEQRRLVARELGL